MAIFKKRGKWWIGYRVNGQRRREPTGSTSYALAKEILAKRLTEVAEQRHFPGRVANVRPFAQVADRYWELHGRFLLSPTWKWMFQRIKARFAGKKVGAITTADVQRYYNEIAGVHTKATANRYLGLLRSMFNKAHDWEDFHGDNPCSRVEKGRESPHRLRYLSHEEMERLQAAAHPRLYPVLLCALLTGMRRGEILGLTWENVNLEQGTIYLLKTKSGKPREIPIPTKLHDVLMSMGPQPAGSVFNLPLIMLQRYFKKALERAGIFGFRFHDLRHTFASHFVMQTHNLPALQKLLGHSTPTMTQRYAHLGSGHLASEMAAFESAIPVKPQTPMLEGHHLGHHPVSSHTPVS
ncbi:MAG: site-specific integrase [Elusimicrobia bacterium]|nr:site-specific integrase [Elusimicrobiota bacterium]